MNTSCPMVHAQQVDRNYVKEENREANKARSYDRGSFKGRLYINVMSRSKKRFYNHVPPKYHKARDNRVSNPKSKKGRGTSSPRKKTTCRK